MVEAPAMLPYVLPRRRRRARGASASPRLSRANPRSLFEGVLPRVQLHPRVAESFPADELPVVPPLLVAPPELLPVLPPVEDLPPLPTEPPWAPPVPFGLPPLALPPLA